MSDGDRLPISRRKVLAGFTALGTVGALTGVGTAAFLSDRETLGNAWQAGEIVLDLTDPESGSADLTFNGLEPGESRTESLCIAVETNPAWVWIRLCPDGDELASILDATLTIGGDVVATGTLGEVLSALGGVGRSLTGSVPLEPGEDEAVCVDLTVSAPTVASLDERERTYLGKSPSLTLTLDVYAEQSRNVPYRSPWVDDPCDDVPPPENEPSPAISFIVFCSTGPLSESDFEYVRGDVDSRVEWKLRDDSTASVDAMAVKGATVLRRLSFDPAVTSGSVAPGDGDVDPSYQPGPGNDTPCLDGMTGVKFEEDDVDGGSP